MNHRYRPTVSTWLKRLAALALSLAGTAALAQAAWPSKPIKLVVPYGAGSSPDVIARIMGEKLATRLGQPVIVENRVGGGGNNGTGSVAKSPGDGYTYVISTNGPLVYNTVLYKKLPYDPFTELRPVVLAGGQANVCTVRADSGINSLQELVAAMKKNPGKFNFSSTGVGSLSQLGVELLKVKTDTYAVHIPYASSPLAVLAILQGDVQFACVPAVAVLPQVKAGKLRTLAVSTAQAQPVDPGHSHDEGSRPSRDRKPGLDGRDGTGQHAHRHRAAHEPGDQCRSGHARGPRKAARPVHGADRRDTGSAAELHAAGTPGHDPDHQAHRHHHRVSDDRRPGHPAPSR
jgi:tripartite-type tricarboxylate transporter receptor subunit TctC